MFSVLFSLFFEPSPALGPFSLRKDKNHLDGITFWRVFLRQYVANGAADLVSDISVSFRLFRHTHTHTEAHTLLYFGHRAPRFGGGREGSKQHIHTFKLMSKNVIQKAHSLSGLSLPMRL